MNRPLLVGATLVAAALSMLLPGTALAKDNKPDNWTG